MNLSAWVTVATGTAAAAEVADGERFTDAAAAVANVGIRTRVVASRILEGNDNSFVRLWGLRHSYGGYDCHGESDGEMDLGESDGVMSHGESDGEMERGHTRPRDRLVGGHGCYDGTSASWNYVGTECVELSHGEMKKGHTSPRDRALRFAEMECGGMSYDESDGESDGEMKRGHARPRDR